MQFMYSNIVHCTNEYYVSSSPNPESFHSLKRRVEQFREWYRERNKLRVLTCPRLHLLLTCLFITSLAYQCVCVKSTKLDKAAAEPQAVPESKTNSIFTILHLAISAYVIYRASHSVRRLPWPCPDPQVRFDRREWNTVIWPRDSRM